MNPQWLYNTENLAIYGARHFRNFRFTQVTLFSAIESHPTKAMVKHRQLLSNSKRSQNVLSQKRLRSMINQTKFKLENSEDVKVQFDPADLRTKKQTEEFLLWVKLTT